MQGNQISAYVRLEAMFHGTEGQIARREDQVMRAEDPSQMITIIAFPDPRLSRIGPLITTTDRELRRAVNILGGDISGFEADTFTVGKGPGARPKPISSLDGGLWVSDADTGSLVLIAVPFGKLMALLLSRPVSAFVTATALWGSAGHIFAWRRRRKDPLEGITARQALEVLKAFSGDAQRLMHNDPQPDLDLEVAPAMVQGGDIDPALLEDEPSYPAETAIYRRNQIEQEAEPSEPKEVRPAFTISGVGLTGRRITHIRQHPDGTVDIIYVEG